MSLKQGNFRAARDSNFTYVCETLREAPVGGTTAPMREPPIDDGVSLNDRSPGREKPRLPAGQKPAALARRCFEFDGFDCLIMQVAGSLVAETWL